MAPETTIRFVAKPLVFGACLAPLAWLAWQVPTGGMGANPIEATNRFLGDWALRFLLISLAVTPVREIFDKPVVMRFRRMLGLFAFFYVAAHLVSYVVLDQFFDWTAIGKDILKRPYITIGMTGFALLIPLAVTSTKGWIRRLGGPRWKKLHTLVYPAAVLGVAHFALLVKADLSEPLLYGAILAALLGWRVHAKLQKRRRRIARRAARRAALDMA